VATTNVVFKFLAKCQTVTMVQNFEVNKRDGSGIPRFFIGDLENSPTTCSDEKQQYLSLKKIFGQLIVTAKRNFIYLLLLIYRTAFLLG